MKKKEKGKTKKTRRSEVKYPALDSDFMPKVRQEYFDLDYIDQLDDTEKNVALPDGTMVTEKEWMNKFMNEELNASFKNDGTDLAQTKEEKRRAYSKNNARNRCLYGVTKINGLLQNEDVPIFNDNNDISNYELTEDAMIADLDNKYGGVDDEN